MNIWRRLFGGQTSDPTSESAKLTSVETANVPLANQYLNTRFNVSLRYPQGWEVLFENEVEGTWSKLVAIGGPKSSTGRPGVTVQVSPSIKSFAVPPYMRKAESDLRQTLSGLRMLRAEERQVNDWPAACDVHLS